MQKRYIVTATPPTPNGDFHVGHLAGPYLGADLFARFQRMRGNDVVYVSSSDRNQSYVVTTAERLGIAPERLASDCHREMVKTLAAGRISVDAFNAPDTAHCAMVEAFFSKLEARGHVKRKTRRTPYSPGEGRHLFESYLSGFCPTCWAATAGAICETCGHPNDADSLELPAARSGGVIEFVETEVAVLELESFRDRFEAFYAEKRGQWRPHLMEFVEEMLARPLPDYPLTYLSQWGIPAPFPGLEGQVLNVWAEMLPGLMNSTREACKAANQHAEKGLAFWHKDDGAELVQFIGYDNAFFFAFVHLALTWGVGETILRPRENPNTGLRVDHDLSGVSEVRSFRVLTWTEYNLVVVAGGLLFKFLFAGLQGAISPGVGPWRFILCRRCRLGLRLLVSGHGRSRL